MKLRNFAFTASVQSSEGITPSWNTSGSIPLLEDLGIGENKQNPTTHTQEND